MDTMDEKAERHFSRKNAKLQTCTTVQELLTEMSQDTQGRQIAYYIYLKKLFNEQFKNNFKQCLNYCTDFVAQQEQNYFIDSY